MNKKILAYHDCPIMHSRFVIYEDGTTTMFALSYDSNKPDYFYPNEKTFATLLNQIMMERN